MFRLAIFGDLVGQVIFICLAIALYRLLRNVSRPWALADGRRLFWFPLPLVS